METKGKGIKFHRIRRITGYLVGTTDRFNNAKQAEERDRVKHMSWGSEYEAREPREDDYADSESIPAPDGGDTNG